MSIETPSPAQTSEPRGRIDFARINLEALRRLPDLVADWYPAGRAQGAEWRTGSLRSDEMGASAAINLETGRAKDHASEDAAGDPVGLYALRYDLSNGEAAEELARCLGIEARPQRQRRGRPPCEPSAHDVSQRLTSQNESESDAVSAEQERPAGLTLLQYSEAKGLDEALLRRWGLRDGNHGRTRSVVMPYKGPDGETLALRHRVAISGGDKFLWRKGDKVNVAGLYGVWMLRWWRKDGKRRLWIVEGESDCHTLWQAGEAALGVPGATTIAKHPEWLQAADGFDEVVVVHEGGTAAEGLVHAVRWSCVRDRLLVVDIQAEVDTESKDPSALWERCGQDKEAFRAKLDMALETAVDADGKAVDQAPPLAPPREWTPIVDRDLAPRPWLYGNICIQGEITIMQSPGGMGKSTLMLAMAVSVAIGEDLLGNRKIYGGPQAALYWSGEDSCDEIARRVFAICKHYRIDQERLQGKLFFASALDDEHAMVIACQDGNDVVVAEPVVGLLHDILSERQIRLLIIDPMVAFHECEENANGPMNQVARAWKHIARTAECAIAAVTHTRKLGFGENTADSNRGASSMRDACRVQLTLNAMTEDEASKAGVPKEQRWRHLRMDTRKSNHAPPSEFATWFRLESVTLRNGTDDYPDDSVGVPAPWQWPGVLDDVTKDDIARLLGAMRSSTDVRADSRAKEWFGNLVAEVFGWDLAEDRPRVLKAIKEWEASGMIRRAAVEDDWRHKKIVFLPGEKPE
jgi:hypothetical protein